MNVLLPNSLISVSESIIFHLQRRNTGATISQIKWYALRYMKPPPSGNSNNIFIYSGIKISGIEN